MQCPKTGVSLDKVNLTKFANPWFLKPNNCLKKQKQINGLHKNVERSNQVAELTGLAIFGLILLARQFYRLSGYLSRQQFDELSNTSFNALKILYGSALHAVI